MELTACTSRSPTSTPRVEEPTNWKAAHKLRDSTFRRDSDDYIPCSDFELPIFLPYGTFMQYWNTFIILILTYSLMEIPYVIAFEISMDPSELIPIIGLVIDCLLISDIILNFRTAYIDKYDRLRIIGDPKLIAKKYLRGWFVVDLLSSLPIAYVMMVFSGHGSDVRALSSYLRLLRAFKVLRAARLYKMLQKMGESYKNKTGKTLLNLMKIVAFMLMTAHYFACAWYFVGMTARKNEMPAWVDVIWDDGHGDDSNLVHFTYAFYWAIVTLFTTGYGDITATNIYEQFSNSLVH